MPKLRWVVCDPPHLTDHFIKVTGMAEKQSVCAECGLAGWNWKCAECGCESGIRQGSPGYGPAVNDRAARMKMQAEGTLETSPSAGDSKTADTATEPSGRKAMDIYQYKVLSQKDKFFSRKFDPEQLEKALNSFAGEGWRLNSAATAEIGMGMGSREEMIFILERPA